jgi:hypothetical protein
MTPITASRDVIFFERMWSGFEVPFDGAEEAAATDLSIIALEYRVQADYV